MKRSMSWRTALLALPIAALGLLAGCDDGPFERAGEKIDRAGDKVERKIDDAVH